MNIKLLVIGESGTGKSTSIRTLDPKSTYIINVLDKPLPFKESAKHYNKKDPNKKTPGNMFASKNSLEIKNCIKYVNKEMHNIKTLIIDDFQYIMASEFMEKALTKGYEKFSEIAFHAWEIIEETSKLRNDLTVVFLTHSELDSNGQTKVKTIGKMLDEKVCIEGMFSIVLNSIYHEDNYYFLTKNEGIYRSKTPIGMFDKKIITNDLKLVIESITDYYKNIEEDIPQ